MNVQTTALRPTSRRAKRQDLPLEPGTAIRETAELTVAVLESFPGYLALLDAQGVVFSANSAWMELNRETARDGVACAALGESYPAALRDIAARGHDYAACIRDLLDEVLGMEPIHERSERTCTTLDKRLLVVVAQRLQRPAGGAIVTAVDVTSWATSALALQRAQRDLLNAAQLAVGGELVGAITHDLRQPLTSLQMNLEIAAHLLRQKPAEVSRALEAVSDAGDEGKRLRDSVQVLQDLVMHREPRFGVLALDSVVSEVIRLVQSEAITRHVVIEREMDTQLPSLHADPTMLREATLSLLLDAIENSDGTHGPARISIATRAVGDDHVELVVNHRRLRQVADSHGWVHSVVRSVADAHGATTTVDETPETGVTVRTIWPTQRERLPYRA